MKRTAVATILAAVTLGLIGSAAKTAPKPSEVAIRWELEIRFENPQAIEVLLPGEDETQRFWYIRYTVTNQTGEDRIFVPEFEMFTDTGQILRAGEHVPKSVFKDIKKLYNEPLLKDTTAMTGKLLQDEDNAKDGVAIWPQFDPKAGAFDIFLGGLSGETAEVQLPRPVKVTELDVDGKKRTVTKTKVILSKTLQLTYTLPGEESARTRTKPKLLKKNWVMR
jgi:hypothetical protein